MTGLPHEQTYILHPDVALRSWERVPHAYIRRYEARPRWLPVDAFQAALHCDGHTLLGPSAGLELLVREGLAAPCEPGQACTTPWQRHRTHPNRVTPWMALEITARCNYNCIHCFNAADNARLHAELSLDQVERLLDEACDAGVRAVLLTGGEPLVHPRFLDIVHAVYERDLFVHELNTNGRLLDSVVLGYLAALPRRPEIKVSFDGLGFHDWMRSCAGAEQDALHAIGRAVEAGFDVRVQTNANRRNLPSLPRTIRLLAEMGVKAMRVIRTTPTPRWEANAAGECLEWAEYLECSLDLLGGHARDGHAMELDIWHVATLYPREHAYRLAPVRYSKATFKPSRPCCPTSNGMVAIGADGRVYPCLQCSGWMEAHGIVLGNALQTGLAPLLKSGPYHDLARLTVADKLRPCEGGAGRQGHPCASCPWLCWCAGGCPAMAILASNGDPHGPDLTCCEFFLNGWPSRFEEALPGWRNLSPLL